MERKEESLDNKERQSKIEEPGTFGKIIGSIIFGMIPGSVIMLAIPMFSSGSGVSLNASSQSFWNLPVLELIGIWFLLSCCCGACFYITIKSYEEKDKNAPSPPQKKP